MRGIYNITATVALLFVSFVAYAQSEVDEQQIYEKVAAYTAEQYVAEMVEITKIDAKQPEQIRWQHGLRVGYGPHGIISLLMLTGDISRDIYMSDYMIFKQSRSLTLSDEIRSARSYWGKEILVANISAEYFRTVKPWLTLGGKSSFASYHAGKYDIVSHEKILPYNIYTVSLLFNVRFEWLRRDFIQLYSGVGAGLAARFEYNNGIIVPMVDYTGFGMSIGRAFHGYIEFGGGISGWMRVGLGYRFNTK